MDELLLCVKRLCNLVVLSLVKNEMYCQSISENYLYHIKRLCILNQYLRFLYPSVGYLSVNKWILHQRISEYTFYR